MPDEQEHNHHHHHFNDDDDDHDDGDHGDNDDEGNESKYRRVRERLPEKGRKSRKFTRRGARIPGYLDLPGPGYLVLTGWMGLGQDTWIPGYQNKPGYPNTWIPSF